MLAFLMRITNLEHQEVESLDDIKKDIKYWDYTEVLEVHEALQKANENINKLGLVPVSS